MRDFRYVLRDFRYADVRSALVSVGLSEGPRYTDIQILRAGRTKKSEQRNEKQSQEAIRNQKQSTRTKQDNTGRKTSIPTTKAENQNYTHEKEATRVLHPAPRLTPENGGIPPFYGCC